MTDNATKSTNEITETTARVAFELTPAMATEVDRIQKLTGLNSKPEVFRRALARSYAYTSMPLPVGREIYMVDPDRPNYK